TSSGVKTRLKKRSPKRSREALIRGTSMMSTPVPTIICDTLPRYHILRFCDSKAILIKRETTQEFQRYNVAALFREALYSSPCNSNLPSLPSQKGANLRIKECVKCTM